MTDAHCNTTVKNITWRGVSVTAKDRETKKIETIVDNVEGFVQAGEMCALMGPSGCGKTTLLKVLARRLPNGSNVKSTITCFVEQEDSLVGALTVRETLDFSSRLAGTRFPSRRERLLRIDALLHSFGLADQANTIIGTTMRKGISGGQKRRVGVASQLITGPKILFLDEPTSGLDSAASWEISITTHDTITAIEKSGSDPTLELSDNGIPPSKTSRYLSLLHRGFIKSYRDSIVYAIRLIMYAALAILIALANGLWMAVSGFMVPPTALNAFYKYVFQYWDYQKYVFEDQCSIAGQAVLDQYGYEPGHLGKNVGIMISIIFCYRLASWIMLQFRE
ncbi:ABC transporter [Hirsutella rhossiliensis]|uniref:ABC transporter domain-containing protein n=1 Tax=Hirsutella rhossiliensis TaxID=111463 RepID=A0A9P8ML28_9HYPO|nr:ABC transporter domain-containing protein [Hirsutella rhossiliensis]KAH0958273.1 ABC transporter domain-containing protein [Hirsutella rhossiliensis]